MSTICLRTLWSAIRATYAPRLLKRLDVELEDGPMPEHSFLLVSDHSNTLDPYVLGCLSPRPIRFMANLEGVHPAKAALAGLFGAFGRRKGMNDLKALRRTIAIARGGDSIGIFPEGDRSWDGAGAPIRPGIGRLAKKLGLPLLIARQKGNYLAMPRWAKRPRRGPWSVELLRYDADEVAALSDGLLDAVVARALSKDEVKDSAREGRIFSGEGLAEGVERLLWRCPICGSTDAIRGRGDEISCGECGAAWRVDGNLRIRPLRSPAADAASPASAFADLKDWNDWQVSTLPSFFGPTPGRQVFRSLRVALSELRNGRRILLGRGSLSLAGGELRFEAKAARRAFEAARVRGFIDNFNSWCEFSAEGSRWVLEFDGGNASKWAYALALHVSGAAKGEGAAA